MGAWGKVGPICDWLSIAALVMSFKYMMTMEDQIPQNTWVVAFLLFAAGRGLGDYNRNRRWIMDGRAAVPQNG